MDEQIQRIPSNNFLDVSSVSDIAKYVGLLHRAIDLSSEIVEYQKVVKEYEIIEKYEETKRLEIKATADREMVGLSRQLDMLEEDLLADIDRLKVFVEGTMNAVQELIREGQYEFADKFHARVADRLEGRVSLVLGQQKKLG